MKNVVAFVGSPRRNGNTGTAVNEVLRGAAEAGAETKVYYLDEMNIRGCQSCLYCRANAGCSEQDDMQQVYEDMRQADAFVIGSPIYMWQVSGQTKTFLDRLFPLTDFAHNPRFGEKKMVWVYSQAAPQPDQFKQYIEYNANMVRPLGLQVIESLVITGAFRPNVAAADKELMRQAYAAGGELVK